MVARESLALKNNLMPPLLLRPIKRGQNKMQIRRQRLHDRDLLLVRAHQRRHRLRGRVVGVQPCRQRGVAQGLEVTLHALRGPGGEVLLQALGDAAWL